MRLWLWISLRKQETMATENPSCSLTGIFPVDYVSTLSSSTKLPSNRCVHLIGPRGWTARVPLVPLVVASSVVEAAARDTCPCEDLQVLLPDFSWHVIEMFVDFVLGKALEVDSPSLSELSSLFDVLGMQLDMAGITDLSRCDTPHVDNVVPTVKQEQQDNDMEIDIYKDSNCETMECVKLEMNYDDFISEAQSEHDVEDREMCETNVNTFEERSVYDDEAASNDADMLSVLPDENGHPQQKNRRREYIQSSDQCIRGNQNEINVSSGMGSVLERARIATESLLPAKSLARYNKEFQIFCEWRQRNDVSALDETVMLAYFQELSEKFSVSTLWSKYSILKSTLLANESVNISKLNRLVAFIKQKSRGYIPKKSRSFTGDEVLQFLHNAPDETHLLNKVVLIMGIFGGLSREELLKITIDDIEDKGPALVVRIPGTKTGDRKDFTILEEEPIGAAKLVRQYRELRPADIQDKRFFLTYRHYRCTSQPVGINTIGSVASKIAAYLRLDNAKEYTGHCFRRTSAALLTQGGATFAVLKRPGNYVAEGDGKAEPSCSSTSTHEELMVKSEVCDLAILS